METPRELTLDCRPGDLVQWSTVGGERFVGRLKEWDNGTAIIVQSDGKEYAVRGC